MPDDTLALMGVWKMMAEEPNAGLGQQRSAPQKSGTHLPLRVASHHSATRRTAWKSNLGLFEGTLLAVVTHPETV